MRLCEFYCCDEDNQRKLPERGEIYNFVKVGKKVRDEELEMRDEQRASWQLIVIPKKLSHCTILRLTDQKRNKRNKRRVIKWNNLFAG